MPIQELINNPQAFLMDLLVSLPAILVALVFHETAHGYAAYRCGDPTAKMMGRLSLNPLKHLDPVGTLLMIFAGFGWAKPVPVNPGNFRRGRRDDLIVSLAGITVNVILFLFFTLVTQIMITLAIRFDSWAWSARDAAELVRWAPLWTQDMIAEFWGRPFAIGYEVISNLAIINLSLALFNLLPIPPLDGYHVLNDLVLKKDLFASSRVAQIASSIFFVMVLTTDYIGQGIGWVVTHAVEGLGIAYHFIVSLAGWL